MEKRRITAILMVIITSLMWIPSMNGQFLKNISKGLEKAKKAVEKVEKATRQGTNNSGNAGVSESDNRSSTTDEEAYGDQQEVFGEADGNEAPHYNYPFFTSGTMFLEAAYYTLSNVHEGIFYIKRDDNYEFWKVDGTKLCDPVWKKCVITMGEKEPEFNSGVVAMVRPNPDTYKPGTVCLLYSDGRVKELDHSIGGVTNFKDGVAIASADNKYFFIDTSGKKIYPNISLSNSEIRPLRDGLRAYPKMYNEWGYIDAAGAVKLAPTYKEANDFSEGHAWVVMADGSKHLIDTTGKSVFRAPEGNSWTSPVVDGRFFVRRGSETCYYDLQGNLLQCFTSGTHFYGGYAFIGTKNDIKTYVIDKDMHPLNGGQLTVVPEKEIWENGPYFNKENLASVGSFIVHPDGTVKISELESTASGYYDSFGTFGRISDCGYVTGIIHFMDKTASFIMKSDGEIVMVISDEPKFEAPIPCRFVNLRENGARILDGDFRLKRLDIHQKPLCSK